MTETVPTTREALEQELRERVPPEARNHDLSIFTDNQLRELIASAIKLEMRREQPRKRTRRR